MLSLSFGALKHSHPLWEKKEEMANIYCVFAIDFHFVISLNVNNLIVDIYNVENAFLFCGLVGEEDHNVENKKYFRTSNFDVSKTGQPTKAIPYRYGKIRVLGFSFPKTRVVFTLGHSI